MIVWPPKTRKNKWPEVVLMCDGVACGEHQRFPCGTTAAEITQIWFRANFWTAKFRNGKFEHRCAQCQLLTKAPAAYLAQLQA